MRSHCWVFPPWSCPRRRRVFGLIAIRPFRGERPVGVTPAKIGLLLAIFFATCGYFIPYLKTKTLGEQAKVYSRQYIEVIARDYETFAMELNKDFRNRFSDTMPLEDYYQNISGDAVQSMQEFQNNGAHEAIRRVGPDGEWVLDRPVRIFKSYRIDRAEVVWRSRKTGQLVQFFMQCLIDPNDVGQWHIEHIQEYRERLVADSVL